MLTNRWWRVVFLWAVCLAFSAAAQPAPVTSTSLILSADAAKPGETVWAGLRMDIPSGWHVYWRNGGDSGAPVSISWTLPPGVTAGPIIWPTPFKEVDKGGDEQFVTYVYSNQVVLLTQLKLADDAKPGSLTLKASVNWLECSKQCVMANSDVDATLAVGAEDKPSPAAAVIEQWRKKIPSAAPADIVTVYWQGTQIVSNSRPFVIEWKTGPASADFYPNGGSNYTVEGATEILKTEGGGVRIKKMLTKSGDTWPDHVEGVLVGDPATPKQVGMEVSLNIQPPRPTEKKSTAPIAPAELFTMLSFAFLGGLILNIMPCVLPVIALKIFSFVKQAGEKPGRVRNLGLVYGAGVLVSFLALAGFTIAVQAAGGQANWGALLRIPSVQLGTTVLVTLIALNLFGLFEITLSSRATGTAYELASKEGFAGAFFNGVLATLLATPCTAPFLGAAVTFALGQSALVTVLFFLTAGIGFAFPFVVLCVQPRWISWLPKPGAWMEKFKIAMGFPMLATAFWLMWISASDENSILWLGMFLVMLGMVAWIWGQFVQRGRKGKAWAAALCVILLGLDYSFVLNGHVSEINWQPWSADAVEKAQREGHLVLVDFTAKSCLTCQVNRASAIEVKSTREKLKKMGVVALVGDYTREDPAIGKELRHYNHSGVPLVLVFPKDPSKPPIELPTFPLTPSDVAAALDRAAM